MSNEEAVWCVAIQEVQQSPIVTWVAMKQAKQICFSWPSSSSVYFKNKIHMDVSVCWIQVWLMQRAGTLQTSHLQQGKLPWLQTLLTSWMARLSVSLAADAIRCLHGCQIPLDTFKHKDVCWVVRCSMCTTLSEYPSFLGAVLFYLELSTSNRQMCDWFAGYSFFITAQIRAVLEGNSFPDLDSIQGAIFAQEKIYKDPWANIQKSI